MYNLIENLYKYVVPVYMYNANTYTYIYMYSSIVLMHTLTFIFNIVLLCSIVILTVMFKDFNDSTRQSSTHNNRGMV